MRRNHLNNWFFTDAIFSLKFVLAYVTPLIFAAELDRAIGLRFPSLSYPLLLISLRLHASCP